MDIKICNFCSKEFDSNDYINGGSITDNLTGLDDFDMCSNCYHKILKLLIPRCKIEPFMDECENDDDEDEDVNNE